MAVSLCYTSLGTSGFSTVINLVIPFISEDKTLTFSHDRTKTFIRFKLSEQFLSENN